MTLPPIAVGVVEPATNDAAEVVEVIATVLESVVAPETENAPVSAMVPSTAFAIVSPFKRVIDVVEAIPPS